MLKLPWNHCMNISKCAHGAQNSLILMSNSLQSLEKKVVIGSLWVWTKEKNLLGVETGSIDLQSTSTNPGGSLPLWPVDHAQPRPFRKHPKHGFYPLLKWHHKHVTWVIYDKLKRDFRSCVRFHTLNKEY